AEEALAMMREAARNGRPYDLVLLDMQMPRMSGLDLAKLIKADPAIAVAKLVMLTSMHHKPPREILEAAQIVKALLKPVKKKPLHEVIMNTLCLQPSGKTLKQGTTSFRR